MRGWTQKELARRLTHRMGILSRREKIARWETGTVEPDFGSQCALAEELGVPADRLRTHLWPKWLPAGEQFLIEGVWTSESCHDHLDSTVGDVLLDHRGFVTIASGSAAVLAREWRGQDGPSALPEGTATDMVDSVATRLPRLRDLEDIHGGGRVRVLVDSELRVATELLRGPSLGRVQEQRLFRLCAELSRIAGWASTDTGYLASAERYFVLGLRAARAGGDVLSGANLLKCMSLLLAEAGRADEALTLARAGVAGTAGGPSRVEAMLVVREARLHAMLGERRACEQMLSRAEKLMERDDGRPCPKWADYFDAAEYAAQVAACYLALGDHQVSDHWLETTLRMQPPSRERDGITYRLWRAENAISLRNFEHVWDHLAVAASGIQRGSSWRNRTRFAEVRRLLIPHRSLPLVRDLDERVASLLA